MSDLKWVSCDHTPIGCDVLSNGSHGGINVKVRAGSERTEVTSDPLCCLVTECDSEVPFMASCWVVARERLSCSEGTWRVRRYNQTGVHLP